MDINRIRAKSYTDNRGDLMAAKLKRLSASTQEALKEFACLGNVPRSLRCSGPRETAEASTRHCGKPFAPASFPSGERLRISA